MKYVCDGTVCWYCAADAVVQKLAGNDEAGLDVRWAKRCEQILHSEVGHLLSLSCLFVCRQ